MRPKYKELYYKALEAIKYQNQSKFTILKDGDRDCEHLFSWVVDSQGEGFAGAVYTCEKCNMVIDQMIGERYTPENIPNDPNIRTWRE
jgi:hypothetical protein